MTARCLLEQMRRVTLEEKHAKEGHFLVDLRRRAGSVRASESLRSDTFCDSDPTDPDCIGPFP